MKSSAITIVSGLAVERLDCLPGKAILHSKESVHSPSVTPAVRFWGPFRKIKACIYLLSTYTRPDSSCIQPVKFCPPTNKIAPMVRLQNSFLPSQQFLNRWFLYISYLIFFTYLFVRWWNEYFRRWKGGMTRKIRKISSTLLSYPIFRITVDPILFYSGLNSICHVRDHDIPKILEKNSVITWNDIKKKKIPVNN